MKKILCLLFCLGFGMPISVLAQEEKPPPMEIDEQEPALSVWCNQEEVHDHLDLRQSSVLEVFVKEDIQSVSVWIDEDPYLFEIVEGAFEIPVSTENQKILIQAANLLEETITKEIEVHVLSDLKAQIDLDSMYTLKDTHQIQFGSTCLDEVQAEIYLDDVLMQTIDCQGKDQVSFSLSKSGKILVKLKYRDCEAPVLINDSESITFFFSCEPPEIQIIPEATMSNHDILVKFVAPDFMKEVEVYVDDGQSIQTYSSLEDLSLFKRNGEVVTYQITVKGSDSFGRSFTKEQQVMIDAQNPALTLYHHDQILRPGTLNVFSERSSLNLIWDEPVQMKAFAWVQGKEIEIQDLNSFWTSWPDHSLLSLWIQGKDQVGNIGQYAFELQIIPPVLPAVPETPIQDTIETLKPESDAIEELKPELDTTEDLKTDKEIKEQSGEEKEIKTLNTSWIPGNMQDVKKVQRTWKINDSHQVVLEKQEEEIQDHTRPLIQIRAGKDGNLSKLSLGDRVRITLVNTQAYSQDRFVEILINEEKVNLDLLEKDALGNEYFEFEIEDPTTTIEAKAMDNSENTTTIYKTLKVREEQSVSWLPLVLMGTIGFIGIVVVIFLRKHDANQDLEK